MTTEDSLIQVLSAVGEMKAELVGFSVETRASFRAIAQRLDVANGKLLKGETWMNEHDGLHARTIAGAETAEAYDRGRAFERQRAVGMVQRAYEIITHPIVLGAVGVALVVSGWLLGAVT